MGQSSAEIAHFNQFLNLLKLSHEFEQCEEPQPDFKIVINEKVVGIEHTRLFLPKDSKGNDPVKHHVSGNRIIENAERMFKKIRNEKLTVTVNFFGSYGLNLQPNMLTGKDVKGLSKFICDFVLINIPEYGRRKSFEQYDMQIGEQILPDQIDHISIDHKYDCWSQSEGGLVPDIRSEALYKRIASKDSKLRNYNREWDEVWLLVVENQWNMLSYFDFSYANEINVDSHFNRIFIMRSGNNEVYECNNGIPPNERWKGGDYIG